MKIQSNNACIVCVLVSEFFLTAAGDSVCSLVGIVVDGGSNVLGRQLAGSLE